MKRLISIAYFAFLSTLIVFFIFIAIYNTLFQDKIFIGILGFAGIALFAIPWHESLHELRKEEVI